MIKHIICKHALLHKRCSISMWFPVVFQLRMDYEIMGCLIGLALWQNCTLEPWHVTTRWCLGHVHWMNFAEGSAMSFWKMWIDFYLANKNGDTSDNMDSCSREYDIICWIMMVSYLRRTQRLDALYGFGSESTKKKRPASEIMQRLLDQRWWWRWSWIQLRNCSCHA